MTNLYAIAEMIKGTPIHLKILDEGKRYGDEVYIVCKKGAHEAYRFNIKKTKVISLYVGD